MTKKGRLIIAYHEAGHAVAARALGVRVPSVTIILDHDHDGRGTIESARWATRAGSQGERQKACEIEIKIAMAGVLAEHRHQKWRSFHFGAAPEAAGDDKQALYGMLDHLCLANGQEPPDWEALRVELSDGDMSYMRTSWARLWAETQTLVSERWVAITRVAVALMLRGSLNQPELDALIAA